MCQEQFERCKALNFRGWNSHNQVLGTLTLVIQCMGIHSMQKKPLHDLNVRMLSRQMQAIVPTVINKSYIPPLLMQQLQNIHMIA